MTTPHNTFQFEDDLPPLPIPDLAHSCNLYLDSVEACLQSAAIPDSEKQRAVANTRRIVAEFINGDGKRLHEAFATEASNLKNWLEPLWNYGYLSLRDSSALWINYGGPKRMYPLLNELDVGSRENVQPWNGALFIFLLLEYWKVLRQGGISVDRNAKKEPMSMEQYKYVYNACRRPAPNMDEYVCAFRTEPESCPSHFIVICNGHIFSVDCLDLSPVQIFEQLCHIRKASIEPVKGPGIMTYANRDEWAKCRSWLLSKSKRNAEHFTTIEQACSCVILDLTTPLDTASMVWRALFGDPASRWADKAASYVLFDNGRVNSYCEHSMIDGIIHVLIGHFTDTVLMPKHGGPQKLMAMPANRNKKASRPQELIFDGLEEKYAQETIARVLSQVQSFSADIQVVHTHFELFGTRFAASYGLSIDAICQLAMQLAYMRCHNGQMVPVYKTASSRRFYHGRTETIRSLTPALVKLCKGLLSTVPSLPLEEQWKLFSEAHADHIKITSISSRGQGADRHLLALKATAAKLGQNDAEFFTDQSWRMSGGDGNFVLSSSFSGNFGEVGCCAPMRRAGYGTFYCSDSDGLDFLITAFRSDRPGVNAPLYLQNIQWALCRIKALIDDCGVVKKPAVNAKL